MEKITISGVTLEGFAQGGWQTAIYCPEARCIFDMGVMLPVTVENYFLTHGHPDHSSALPYIVARRSIQDAQRVAKIHVPEQLAAAVRSLIDGADVLYGGRRGKAKAEVVPMKIGDAVQLKGGITVRAVRTFHDAPACGWAVEQTTRKLKPEFVGMEGAEIGRLRQNGVEVTDDVTGTILMVPGDTKIEFLLRCEQARKAKVLTHEVTYWDDQSSPEKCRAFGHTHVDEMIEHCEKFEGESLVLVHRSMKYKRREIEEIIKRRFPAAMLPRIHVFDGGDR
jgi:ribonuclease Z